MVSSFLSASRHSRNNDCYERRFTHSVNYGHSRGAARGTAIHNCGTAPVDYDPAIDSSACQRQSKRPSMSTYVAPAQRHMTRSKLITRPDVKCMRNADSKCETSEFYFCHAAASCIGREGLSKSSSGRYLA